MLVVGAMTLNVKDLGYTFNLKYENKYMLYQKFLKSWYLEILEFCPTTLNRNLVIGKFPITIRMFVSFPLWAFGFEMWNDRHALGVGFGAWQGILV